MTQLTRNFKRSEFACKCGCGQDTVDYALLATLQKLVDDFKKHTGEEVFCIITSGNRCVSHNLGVGGSKNSQHLFSKAADFQVYKKADSSLVDPDLIADILESWFPRSCGIGRYHNRVHFDTRAVPARWDNRSKP